MENMLQSGYLSVLEVKSKDEFQAELVRFTRQLGFETVAATAVLDHFLGESEFITVDNTPTAYRETFFDSGRGKRDPLGQHCKTKSVPIIWNQATYVDAGEADMWDYQAQFGYRYGIALALHLPGGRHFMLGVDRDQALPLCSAEVTRIVAALHLFAVHAQEASEGILFLPASVGDVPTLTPRELEALRWTMEGKTAWELGRILGISEQTAVRHVFNASKKLDCVNKHQAVLKALRLGLIV